MKRITVPVFVLICACGFWGLNWIPLKYFKAHGIEGLVVIFMTHSLLTLLVLPRGVKSLPGKANKKLLCGIGLAGGLGIFSLTYALVNGDVVRVMVLFYLLPVWGVIGGAIFLHEKVDILRWLNVALAVSGAFFILGGTHIVHSPPSWIDFLALFSGVCFALNNILFRGVRDVPLTSKLFAMFLGCSVVTGTLIFLGVENFPRSWDITIWGLLVVYTLTWLLGANIGSQWAIERLEAGRSSIIIISQLIVAVLSATIIGDERLSGVEWFGCFLVVSAAFTEAGRKSAVAGHWKKR